MLQEVLGERVNSVYSYFAWGAGWEGEQWKVMLQEVLGERVSGWTVYSYVAGGAGWEGEGLPGLAERDDQPAEEEGAAEQAGAGRKARQDGRCTRGTNIVCMHCYPPTKKCKFFKFSKKF